MKKKWWEKKEILAAIISILAVIFIYVIYIKVSVPVLPSPGFEIEPPRDCSNSSIKALWDSIFDEISDNAMIFSNNSIVEGMCSPFLAYKIVNNFSYVLHGQGELGYNVFLAFHGNFNQTYTEILSAIDNVEDYWDIDEPLENANLRPSRLLTSEINSTFESIFKITPGIWSFEDHDRERIYFFSQNSTNESTKIATIGAVYANFSLEYFVFKEFLNQTCTSNWQETTTNCTSNDTYKRWYKDANVCNTTTDMPSNITLDCDYDKNKIIGNFTQFTDKNVNLKVYIDNKLANISKNFTTEKTIEFREGNLVRVEFDYNFENELPLNMKIIEIEIQPSSSDFGYMIIKNINQSKTLRIDKLESKSNAVCIKKYEVADIDDLSSKCDKTNEYSVKCPGSLSQFSCSISNDTLLVSGVKNSAVKEFTINQTGTTCTPLWSCTSWSSCINREQTRTCTDSNSCGVTTGKPNVTQSCTSPPQCTPSWSCSSWQPEKCPKEEQQTRTCTDSNSCNIITNKPNESQSCEYKGTNWLFIVVIVILGIAILGIIIAIIIVAARRQPQQAQKSRISIYGSNPQQQFRKF